MILTLTAALCLLGAAGLWRWAFTFTVDTAPVGSMMLVASFLLGIASVFLFGIQVGTML